MTPDDIRAVMQETGEPADVVRRKWALTDRVKWWDIAGGGVGPGHIFWCHDCGAEITWGHTCSCTQRCVCEVRPCSLCNTPARDAYGYNLVEKTPLCGECALDAADRGETFGHKCPSARQA